MNDDNYLTINAQGLAEVSPTASSDSQQEFIDAYRQIQAENTSQIGEQAHALGSDLEAQYGGLHGPSEYIRSRYQTPQTESRLAGLRSAAQLSALNQLMQNDLANWQDKYNQAYRNYRKRSAAAAKASSGNVKVDNSGEYNAQTTLGVSNEDWSSKQAPYGVTRQATGDMVYDSATGKLVPGYVDFANNPDGTPSKTIISSNTQSSTNAPYTADQQFIDQANIIETALDTTGWTALLDPIGFARRTAQRIRTATGGQ